MRQLMSPPTLRQGSGLREDTGLSEESLPVLPSRPYFVILPLDAEAVLISQFGQALLLNLDMLLLVLG